MILSEQHIFARGSKAFSEFEKLCRNANNLYNAIKDYKKNPSKYYGKPHIPGYREKGGFCTVPFTIQSVAFDNCNVKKGFLRLYGDNKWTTIEVDKSILQQEIIKDTF